MMSQWWVRRSSSAVVILASLKTRDGNRVRLFTRPGYNWSGKYPRIVEALLSLRVRSIIVDGEAVWAGTDGKSDFDRLHSHAHDDAVFLYAFDLLTAADKDVVSPHPCSAFPD